MPSRLKTILLVVLAVLAVVGIAGWRFSPQIHDALLAKRPPAPAAEIGAALERGALILDVRMHRETSQEGAELLPGAVNISLLGLERRLEELPRDRPIITYCVSGGRAGKAAEVLRERGFEALSGGGIANLRSILGDADPSRRLPQQGPPSDG